MIHYTQIFILPTKQMAWPGTRIGDEKRKPLPKFAPNIFPNASEIQEVYEVSSEEREGFSFSRINFVLFCFIWCSESFNRRTKDNAFL